jgi:predicted NAD-dependent protein-ADP-ribosyltransferase YbiA (DUF1768 family)/pSer/pThr/pTyr-binding forkhead associated (FHA) protein
MENKLREKNLHHIKTLEDPKDIDKYFGDQAQFYSAKQKLEQITNFNGDFDFLNNEYECPVYFEGLFFPNTYSAYQAARTPSQFYRKKFTEPLSGFEIFELSNQIENPENWDAGRLTVMEKLLRDKFLRNKDLREKLLETGLRNLLNSYNDKTVSNLFWGCVGSEGENHLGHLLMEIRKDIQSEKDLEKWISSQIRLPDDNRLQPDFIIEVFKEGERIEVHELSKKNYYVFGSSSECDLYMPNPSISRRHCLIAFDTKEGLVIVDLDSKWGTFLTPEPLRKLVPEMLDNNTEFRCGSSARVYKISMQFERMQEALERKSYKIDLDIKMLNLKKDKDAPGTEIEKAPLTEKTSDTLFVTGFGTNVIEDDLRASFEAFGVIREVRLPLERYNGAPKGFAFVQFVNSDSTKTALKSTGVYMNDVRLIIKVAEMKKSEVYKNLKESLSKTKNYQQEKNEKKSKNNRRSRGSESSESSSDSRSSKRDKRSKKLKKRKRKDSSDYSSSSSISQSSSESSCKRRKKSKKQKNHSRKYDDSSSESEKKERRRRRR